MDSWSTLWPFCICRLRSVDGSMVMWCDDVRLCLVSGTFMSFELVRLCRSTPLPSISRLLSSSTHLVRGNTVKSKFSTLFRAKCFNCSRLKSRELVRECILKSRDPFREWLWRSFEVDLEKAKSLELERECLDSLESPLHCLRSGLSGSSRECWWLLDSSWIVLESFRKWRDATRTREFFPLPDLDWYESCEYCESFLCSFVLCGSLNESDCDRTMGLLGSSGVHVAELSPDVTPERNPLALSAEGNSSKTVNKHF